MIKTVGPKFGRAIHYDFHTSPGIPNIFGNFDADKFAEQLSAAHVDYINVAARCNMGYSYYNTKVGKKYPGLNDRDPLKEILDACHKKSIGVTAYINLGLDHELSADNYGWLKMSKDGIVHLPNKKANFFRRMCFNTGYRQHLLEEIKEICSYDIDGLFCDCFLLYPCYCPQCMADMNARGIDTSNDAAVMEYQNTIRYEVAEDICRAMGEKRGKIKLYINSMPWAANTQTHAEIECLSSDPQWGYDYFDSMAAYTRPKFQDRVYMSGRFQRSWGDFGGVKPLASMQNDLYDAMMNGFGISFGDHMHPIDGFENEVAARIGKVMEEQMAYEPFVANADCITEVGLLIHSNPKTALLPPFVKGAARMLKELKIPFNVYDETGEFENSKLLLVADGTAFDDDVKKRLVNYVNNGGKVIFTGPAVDLGSQCGLLNFAEILGKDTRDNAYFTLPNSDMRWAVYNPSRIMKNISGTEVAKDVDNVLNFTWDGRQSNFYRPQGNATQNSAAIIGENTACVSFDIFTAYIENFLVEHRDLMKTLIDKLLPCKLIESPNAPKTTAMSLTKNENATVFHIKATYPEHKMTTGIIEEHTYIKSVPVSILGEYKEVYILPEMQKIESEVCDGRTHFSTGDVLGYRAFLLK